jgi:hypothetical protein
MSNKNIKILVFTEGTILMHENAIGHNRDEIIEQVKNNESSVKNYSSYVPIGNSTEKLNKWKAQGVEIVYLTSRKETNEIKDIQNVLSKFDFPKGELVYRKQEEEYNDVAKRIMPDVLVEDDCESIGGEKEMTFTHLPDELKSKIKSVIVKEFLGIDYLPDDIYTIV